MTENKQERSYVLCPDLPVADSAQALVNISVLKAFLAKQGYRQWDNKKTLGEKGFDLVVVLPHPDDPIIGIELLRVFSCVITCGSKPARILYLEPRQGKDVVHSNFNNEDILVFGNRVTDDLSKLTTWLAPPRVQPGKNLPKDYEKKYLLDMNDLRKLLLQSLYKAPNDWNECMDAISSVLSGPEIGDRFRRGINLLNSECAIDFIYGLICLANGYNDLEHRLNAHGRHRFSLQPAVNDALCRQRAILDAASDLLGSLNAFYEFALEPPGSSKTIFLVDDNPVAIQEELLLIVAKLLPGFSIRVWNPRNTNPDNILRKIEHYNSMTGDNDINDVEIELTLFSPDGVSKREKLSFGDLLPAARFVLVDILLNDGVEERNCGPAVIRGLRRLHNDHAETKNPSPQFVAISRADDLTKIQQAFRSGAAGYVLKNRLLSLPAVLAGIRHPIVEPIGALHRNYRQLYFLPNETIGLLHAVTIPPLNFRTGRSSPRKVNRSDNLMADLLAAIPKADLHMHAGSCMSPVFLVEAALVMLARHNQKERKELHESMQILTRFWSGTELVLRLSFLGTPSDLIVFSLARGAAGYEPVRDFAEQVKDEISKKLIEPCGGNSAKQNAMHGLRSVLHKQLGVPDYVSPSQATEDLKKVNDVDLFLFAILNGKVCNPSGGTVREPGEGLESKDLLRLFLLFLACQTKEFQIIHRGQGLNLSKELPDLLSFLHRELYEQEPGEPRPALSCHEFRKRGWEWPFPQKNATGELTEVPALLEVSFGNKESEKHDYLLDCPTLKERPIEYLCASGTRARNLMEYLAGCEYSGAEHLQHPYLIHRYATQTLVYLRRHGVIYTELRAAATGFINPEIGFEYTDVCRCLNVAFRAAQQIAHKAFNPSPPEKCIRLMKTELPAQVNLVLTGKRHKPTRHMITESAAMVVLQSTPRRGVPSARSFVETGFQESGMVGFDLAGQEDGFRPNLYRAQFEMLTRLHIPITVHAGENASAEFVEGAILDLHAQRLGHGLTLADDERLMSRVREEGICIELCPVSNYQTNKFAEGEGEALRYGRTYPLKDYLDNGNAVCLNTDNPIISHTNIIKEYFQASYACKTIGGLSLWEALRIMRMGFIHSFMSMPTRRAMLELVDQTLFDLFMREDIVALLRELARERKGASPS